MKRCKSVIHLAALIGIPYSYESPLAYIRTNVEGTYNILESAKNLNLNNIIITSTSEVYGSAKYLPIDEKHPINAQSPYAASKASADQLSLSFYKSFKLPVKIIRPFNTYGPRQSNRAIIPSIINQCLKNKNGNIILGNTMPTRDFSYVEDTCEAFLKIYNNKKLFGQVVNSGTNSNISIEDLAKKIFKIMKANYKIKTIDLKTRPKLSEVDNLQCNNRKIKKIANWKPKINLEQGLKKTIEWIKSNQSHYSDTYSL
jgi:nucleoside-diphosphate-sugar epimerase